MAAPHPLAPGNGKDWLIASENVRIGNGEKGVVSGSANVNPLDENV